MHNLTDELDPDFQFSDKPLGAPPFVDLRPHIEGTAGQEKPTVAAIGEGQFLFYAGRLNEIHGEPSVGKSNINFAAMKATIETGGTVLFIDPEDMPRGFVARALLFGIDPAELAAKVFYLHNPEPGHILEAQKWAREHKPTMVILDGLAESMAGVGANEDKAQEVLPFFKAWLRPFADAGAAVVISDHVTKNIEGRGRFARGSGGKLGRYDGASYTAELGKAYAPGTEGFLRLRIAKDRNGGVGPVKTVAAELHFIPDINTEGTRLEWRKPEARAGEWMPTAIMEKVIAHLNLYGTDTKRGVCSAIPSKTADVLKAIQCLADDGRLSIETSGTKHILKLASPK